MTKTFYNHFFQNRLPFWTCFLLVCIFLVPSTATAANMRSVEILCCHTNCQGRGGCGKSVAIISTGQCRIAKSIYARGDLLRERYNRDPIACIIRAWNAVGSNILELEYVRYCGSGNRCCLEHPSQVVGNSSRRRRQ